MDLVKTPSQTQICSSKSWVSEYVAVQKSRIEGFGLFAKCFIPQERLVLSLGGAIFTLHEVRAGHVDPDSVTGFDEGLYIGQPIRRGFLKPAEDFLNHSCDPTLWLDGRTKLIARRDVSPGEELTVDYATWEIDHEWRLPKRCNCGAVNCRNEITGRDWKNSTLQERYGDHLLPCLVRRISAHRTFLLETSPNSAVKAPCADGTKPQGLEE